MDACERCHGNRAEPGTPIETCEHCQGLGRVRAVTRTAFGQLVREQACEVCGGEGKIPTQPCEACGGRGRKAVRKTLKVDVPPESPTSSASASPGGATPVSAEGRPETSTCSCA